MKLRFFIINIFFLLFSTNSLSESKNNFQKCKISKLVKNNFEPKIFPNSNNLLRSPGEEAIFCGQKVAILGKLLDKNCVPISDAKIYLWHTGCDNKFHYHPLRNVVEQSLINTKSSATFIGAGITTTDNNGEFLFITTIPGKVYKDKAHYNFRVSHRLFEENFDTKIYFENTKPEIKPQILKSDIEKNFDGEISEVQIVVPYSQETKIF